MCRNGNVDSQIQELRLVGSQDGRVADDLAAKSGGLDCLPKLIFLTGERLVAFVGVAARLGDGLACAGASNAAAGSTNCASKTVHDAVDVGIGLQSSGACVVASVDAISHLGGVGGEVDRVSERFDLKKTKSNNNNNHAE